MACLGSDRKDRELGFLIDINRADIQRERREQIAGQVGTGSVDLIAAEAIAPRQVKQQELLGVVVLGKG